MKRYKVEYYHKYKVPEMAFGPGYPYIFVPQSELFFSKKEALKFQEDNGGTIETVITHPRKFKRV